MGERRVLSSGSHAHYIDEWRVLAKATENKSNPCKNDNLLDETGGKGLELRNIYKCDDGEAFPVSHSTRDIRFIRGDLKEIV